MNYKYAYRGKLSLYYETGMEGHHAVIVMEDRGWSGSEGQYHDLSWSHWFGRKQCYVEIFDNDGMKLYEGLLTWDRTASTNCWMPQEIEKAKWLAWVKDELTVNLYTDECMRADPSYHEYEKELEAERAKRRAAEDVRPRKQVIIVRKDLNMRKGKMIAQGAHASLLAYDYAQDAERIGKPENVVKWILGGYTKVAVGCDSEDQLKELFNAAIAAKLNAAMVRDAGRTEFHGESTLTAVAIGPGPADEIDKITGGLKLL